MLIRLYMLLATMWVAPSDLLPRRERDERGLSQSTENVILLVGAVAIAVIVVGIVRTYVQSYLQLEPPK